MLRVHLIACILFAIVASPLLAQDRDGDGTRDEIEFALGMDVDQPEQLVLIHDDKSAAEGDPLPSAHKLAPDVTKVYFAGVAADRYVWRLDFAEDYAPQGTVLILYLDADNDLTTGRQDGARGVDMMLTCVNGLFSPSIRNDAVALADRRLRGVIDGRSVYMSIDMRLKQTGGKSDYKAWVLCHKAEPDNADQDSTPPFAVLGPGRSDKPRAAIVSASEVRSDDMRVHEPWLGWRDDLRAMAAITLDTTQANLQGMRRLDRALMPQTSGAQAVLKLPKAGQYHVAVVLQDSAVGAEELQLQLNGRQIARAVCVENDGLYHLFVVKTPVQVKQGDALTLIAPAPAQDFQVSEVLLCPKMPQARAMQITNVAAYCPPQTGDTVSVDICWLTNYPCTGLVRWGQGQRLDHATEAEASQTYNHRVNLTGLKRGQKYSAQVDLGPAYDSLAAAPISFVADQLRLAKCAVARQRVPLTVADLLPQVRTSWPVNGGIPIARGQLTSAAKCRLLDAQAQPVPAQFRELSHWPDGSVKWLLVSLVHQGPDPHYQLEYGEQVNALTDWPRALKTEVTPEGLRVTNGHCEVTFPRTGFAPPGIVKLDRQGDGFANDEPICASPDGLTLTDASGQRYTSAGAPVTKLEFEEIGPIRVVVLAEGPLTGATGKLMTWRCRMSVYRGIDMIPTVITLVNDAGSSVMPPTMTSITSLTLPLTVSGAAPSPKLRWLQLDDQHLITEGDMPAAGGTTEPDGAHGRNYAAIEPLTVALKDFWQLYPKAFGLQGKTLTVELLPQLSPDAYAAYTDPKLLTQHYYWAKQGKYRLPMGVALSHDVLFAFNTPQAPELARDWQTPVLLTASPEYICSTGAFLDLEPERAGVFGSFNDFVRKGFDALEATRQRGHEYSYMDYGDWYGERGVNWGNQEYDLQWALLVNFARLGDLRFFDRAEQAARHTAAIDSLNASPDPTRLGLQYEHCLGHTGGFKMARVPDAEYWFESIGCDVGHMWTEGTLTTYCLTGDERYREPAEHLAQWLASSYTRGFDTYVHRNYGWSVIALLGAYHVDPHPYYLNAARLLTDHVIAEQDPGTGVWSHPIGECTHKPLHMGGKVFMSGTVMTGLKMLDQIEPRDDRKQAIVRNCDWMYNRMWHPKDNSFQYAQCTDFDSSSTHAGTYEACEGLAYAYDLTKQPIYREMLVRSLADVVARGPSDRGKEYAMEIRMTPYALSALERGGVTALPSAPASVTIDPAIYLLPGANFGLQATAQNPSEQPCEALVEVVKAPAGLEVSARQARWSLPPRTTACRSLFALTGTPRDDSPIVVRCTVDDVISETQVRLIRPRAISLGKDSGYIGPDADSLGKALTKIGHPLPRVTDLEPATLSHYRSLIIGAEAHGKDCAGLAKQPERLLDFIYSGGRVALLQLQDQAYQPHFLPYPLVLSDAEGVCGQIALPDHPVFNQPHHMSTLKGLMSYDTIVSADSHWRVLAKDGRGQPSIIEADCGKGAVLVVQPSADRYVTGELAPVGDVGVEACSQFLENVLGWLDKR